MDPTENLRRQRLLAAEIAKLVDKRPEQQSTSEMLAYDGHLVELANELADLVTALDEWMTKRGALPAQWAKR